MAARSERYITILSLGVTVLTLTMSFTEIGRSLGNQHPVHGRHVVELSLFSVSMLALFYGNAVYHVTRLGQLRRRAAMAQQGPSELESVYRDPSAPLVSILIPSYKEERSVVLQTVLSAALAEYPNRRVAVLLDDPPRASGADQLALRRTREMIAQVDRSFAVKAGRFKREYRSYEQRAKAGALKLEEEWMRLAELYEGAAEYVEEFGRDYRLVATVAFAHADQFFLDSVISEVASSHLTRAGALSDERERDSTAIAREYRRLASLFDVEITSFERKLYDNLSHEPNKAMNLNSYIGLMGRAYREESKGAGLKLLVECPEDCADFVIPAAPYVLTVDADSVILPSYILKLTGVMEADTSVAVAQTPYAAFPKAPSMIERVAGATTDIQRLVHQGFTHFGATYWVGANALLRLSALEEIKTVTTERNYEVPVFIQDKTVIEDTGSTIDLVRKGWRLFNYPEKLSYSATPPDFGALFIQRSRWSNGGLMIFPDLVRHVADHNAAKARVMETWLRAHYLLSPALAGFGLLVFLVYPFDKLFWNIWLPFSAVPYYVIYGRDLKSSGYRWMDLVRVYSLTLLLLPVNLAGVLRSFHQIMTGKKSAFGRTPKVEGRTAAPASQILALLALTLLATVSCAYNVIRESYLFATFSALNAVGLVYAITIFVGWREAFEDLRLGLFAWLRAPSPHERALELDLHRDAIVADAEGRELEPPPGPRLGRKVPEGAV